MKILLLFILMYLHGSSCLAQDKPKSQYIYKKDTAAYREIIDEYDECVYPNWVRHSEIKHSGLQRSHPEPPPLAGTAAIKLIAIQLLRNRYRDRRMHYDRAV